MSLSFDEVLQHLDKLLNAKGMEEKFLPRNITTQHERTKARFELANFIVQNKLNEKDFLMDPQNQHTIRLAYMAQIAVQRNSNLELEMKDVTRFLLTLKDTLKKEPEKENDLKKELKKHIETIVLKLHPKFGKKELNEEEKKELDKIVNDMVEDHLNHLKVKKPNDPSRSQFELLLLMRELEEFRNLYGFTPPQYQNLLTTYSGYEQKCNSEGVALTNIVEPSFESFIEYLTKNLKGQEYVIDTPEESEKLQQELESIGQIIGLVDTEGEEKIAEKTSTSSLGQTPRLVPPGTPNK